MKNILRLSGAAVAAVTFSVIAPSCAYDPYYYGTGASSVSASYSSGYGYGYGYGGSGFSTSVFVSTGDSRWGYDPYCQSYYDYTRRAYYDPYLYGYYPVGYRPPVLVGCPHPYGWRPGRYCPPPRVIKNVTVVNYRNRENAYRSTNYDWARQVRTKPVTRYAEESRPATRDRNRYQRQDDSYRAPHRNHQGGYGPSHPTNSRTGASSRPDRNPATRSNQRTETRNVTPPRSYTQTPVNQRDPRNQASTRTHSQNRRVESAPASRESERRERRQETREPSPRQHRESGSRPSREEEYRPLRGLGESRRR